MSDRVAEALAFFKFVDDAEATQRQREADDLAFQVPENQWTEDVKATRAGQTVNGVPIPARPMLSIPKLDQPIQLVLNQERRAHLGVEIHPLNEDADDDTAEVIQGLYRRIEVDSRAGLARSWAFERAVKAGRGAYRVLKEYDPNGAHPSDQRIVIKRLLNQGRAYFDPFAQEPDWSDGERALVVDDLPLRTYKRQYPKSALSKYSDEELVGVGSEHANWVGGSDEATRTVRIAEFFYVEYESEPQTWQDAQGADVSRDVKTRKVRWCKVNAIEELESGEWEGQYIPLVPVIGRELIPFDGTRRWTGIIGPNKDAQRLFNYSASGAVEMSALETKASHAVDPEAIEGYEAWWNQKNTRNFPYLPYRRFKGGRDFGEPFPIQADMSKVQMNSLLLSMAGDFIHAGTGAYEPSLGQNSPNVRTKGATLALQNQHDEGNSNWLDNLAEISLTLEAKIVLDLMPYVYDRPGRIARVLDLEDNPRTVMLNQPFVMDPQTKRPVAAQPGQPGTKHYDLSKGRYGVTATVGKARESRLAAGNDALSQILQSEPALVPILGPVWMKFQDWPGHEEAYETLKKMRDHQFPWLADQQDQPDAQQQAQQMKAQLEAMSGQLKQASQIIETDQVKQQAQITIAKIRESGQMQMARMNNATKIAVARISAAKATLDSVREGEEEAIALNQQIAADTNDALHQRSHEVGMAAQAHAHSLEAAQQAHDQAVAQAEQGGQIDAQAADQGHQQALEQGQQATDGQLQVQAAAPQPEAGA